MMYDYWRLFIIDRQQINIILSNPLIEFNQKFIKHTAEVKDFPQAGTIEGWEVCAFSPTHLIISGSIHKAYNNGTNETDFYFSDAKKAINDFCNLFSLNPSLARIRNLEFGVNIHPSILASDIINEIICLKNLRPIRPYEHRPNYYFIEFSGGEFYIKVYDKGKQYGIENILRFELKATKNRCLKFAGIETLEDLLCKDKMTLLGRKTNEFFKHIVFNDNSIPLSELSKSELKTFMLMKDPNEWAKYKGIKKTTHRDREARFKKIVEKYGKNKYSKNIGFLIEEKVLSLIHSEPAVYLPKYSRETSGVTLP